MSNEQDPQHNPPTPKIPPAETATPKPLPPPPEPDVAYKSNTPPKKEERSSQK